MVFKEWTFKGTTVLILFTIDCAYPSVTKYQLENTNLYNFVKKKILVDSAIQKKWKIKLKLGLF